MKSVGIRNLRDSLSKYIALVKDGESILVTDHNEIVAEIVPYDKDLSAAVPLNDYIEDQVKRGVMISSSRTTKLKATTDKELLKNHTVRGELQKIRGERL